MKLNEALDILKDNNYLVEFLQNTKMLDYDKVIDRINKTLDRDFKRDNNKYYKVLPVYKTTKDIKINKLEKKLIQKIARIYNMSVYFRENEQDGFLSITLDSSSLNEPTRIYKPFNNIRLFIHGSTIAPDIIMKTGLRPQLAIKAWANVQGPEKRVYLSSLEKHEDITDNTPLEKIVDQIFNYYDNGYGKYWYLVKLPKHFKIHNDPEGVDLDVTWELDWVYTLNAIPPQYILYINGEDSKYPKATKEDIIKFIGGK